jgi:hypothetical protein
LFWLQALSYIQAQVLVLLSLSVLEEREA